MSVLLRWISLRRLKEHPARTIITILGIALGVAVFLSIRIANRSTLASFRSTVDTIAGKTVLEVRGDETGFDEEIYWHLHGIEGITSLAPVVESTGLVERAEGEILLVHGIDIFTDHNIRQYAFAGQETPEDFTGMLEPFLTRHGIVLTEHFARAHGLTVGSSLSLVTTQGITAYAVVGLLLAQGLGKAQGGNFALVDIATAQETFGRLGKLDRIDIVVAPDVDITAVQQRIAKELPPHLQVTRPERRNEQVEQMLRSFQLNLLGLSLNALFVGMFLIYNTVSVSIVQRREEIGILRSLGVRRQQILCLITIEGLLLGVLGSLVGIGVGILFARFALIFVSRTVTALYLLVAIEQITVGLSEVVVGVGIGVVSALVSTLFPALEASRVSPKEAWQKGSLQTKQLAHYWKVSCTGFGILFLVYPVSLLPPVYDIPVFGYLSAFLVLLGFSLLTAAITHYGCRLLQPLLSWLFAVEGRLAGDNLLSSRGRSSVAIAALAVGFAMMVSVATMINSFKVTIKIWADQTITADLLVIPATKYEGAGSIGIPATLADAIAQMQGVAAVDPYKDLFVAFPQGEAFVIAADFAVFSRYSHYILVEGEREQVRQEMLRGQGILVSDNFRYRYGLGKGETVLLTTPKGPQPFQITGVYVDYASDRGVIFMQRSDYLRYWDDTTLDMIGVYLEPGVPTAQVQQEILQRFGPQYRLFLTSLEDFKSEILRVIDQTFAITYALEVIAVIVAVLGVVNSLFSSILERQWEMGVFRAIGAFKRQLQKMILVEAGLIGFVGSLIGIGAGITLSWILLNVISKQSFGWTIYLHAPFRFIGVSAVVIILIALLSGYLPACQAAQLKITEAIQYE
jgi:putative ABC transport system permease protein